MIARAVRPIRTIVLISALGAASVALCPPRMLAAQDRTIPNKIGAPARAMLERLIDSAGTAGLPTDPLYSKAQEGAFRGADDARVVAAVRRLARDLGDARLALGDSAAAEELTAGANALRAGVVAADLARLRQARGRLRESDRERGRAGDHRLTVALVVLTDLAVRGVPPALAAASVNELVARNVSDNALISFRQTVERDLVSGRSPASALDARTKSILDDVERRKP